MPNMKLPDFEDYDRLAVNIGDLLTQVKMLQNEIEYDEANVVLEVMANKKYWSAGKPPTMSFASTTWKVTGLKNELLAKRDKLAELEGRLERLKRKFSIYHDLIEIYRTESANERVALS